MVDASITSSRVSGGRIAASRRASIVFPPPGGPTSSRLWAPPAAISSARLAYAWPRTSAKSRSSVAGAAGGEDAECDRQVERGTFFPEVGRGQVHGDPVGRKGEAGVADRGAHPLAALAHRRVRKPYRCERGQARRDVDLYPHERGFDADKGCGQDPREHEGIVRSSGGARQCRRLDTIGRGRTRSAGGRARSTKAWT